MKTFTTSRWLYRKSEAEGDVRNWDWNKFHGCWTSILFYLKAFSSQTWKLKSCFMSQSIPTGYILPRATPVDSLKKIAPGVGIWLLKVARGPEIRQGLGFCGKWNWNFIKNMRGSNFYRWKQKKTSRIFDLFKVYTVRVFSVKIFLVYGSIFLVLLSQIPYKKSEELPLACLFEVFTGLWLSTPTVA